MLHFAGGKPVAKATIFYFLDYISLSGISMCGDEKIEKKIELKPKMYKIISTLEASFV